MRICRALLKQLTTSLLSASLLGVVLTIVGSAEPDTTSSHTFSATDIVGEKPGAPTSSGLNDLNPNSPSEVVKLVFIHHSTGDNWLDDGNGDLGAALGEDNYYVSDTYYDWGPPDADLGYDKIGDHTDIGHWYNWFAGPHRDIYLSALYSTTNQHASYSRPMSDPGGENEIIMFKSCYPNSNLMGSPDDPPTTGDNPLRGESVWSSHHTVGNAKAIYNDILAYFETRQDKLFLVITAPPVIDDTYAENARAFNNWLVEDWLDDYAHRNVAVFDFYNVLTTNGGDPDNNDYGWVTGNHHRVVTTTTPITIEHITDGDDDASPNVLEYPTGSGTNNHPSPAGNQKATGEFTPLLNVYYNCWKHGDCGDGTAEWISVTTTSDTASIHPGETATYVLSVTASEGFADPVTATLQGKPPWMTASFDPNPFIPPANSALHISTTTSAVAGTHAMTVTAISGQVSSSTSLTLTVVPTFALNARPSVDSVLPGETAVYTLSLTASEAFAEPVGLELRDAPSWATASFDPYALTPPGTSQLYLTTTTAAAPGTYPMTVIGTSGELSDTAKLTLVLASPPLSFTLSISPTTRAAKPGQAVSYTVTVTALNGYGQPVTLTVPGLPTGIDPIWSINPVTPGDSSILTLVIPGNPPFGDHLLQVVGVADTQVVTRGIQLIIDYPIEIYLPTIVKETPDRRTAESQGGLNDRRGTDQTLYRR